MHEFSGLGMFHSHDGSLQQWEGKLATVILKHEVAQNHGLILSRAATNCSQPLERLEGLGIRISNSRADKRLIHLTTAD